MIIFGEKLYGKVRQMPGIGCIETLFVHIYFFPILPSASYFVLEGSKVGGSQEKGALLPTTKHGFSGVRVPFNWLSVFMAYFRTVIILCIVFTTLLVFVFPFLPEIKFDFGSKKHLWFTGALIGELGLFAISRWVTRASSATANDLCEKLGISRVNENYYTEKGKDEFSSLK